MSGAFHLKDICFKVGHFCLNAFPELTVCIWFGAFIAFATTVAAWIATSVITKCKASASAISVPFLLISASTRVTMSVLLILLLLTPCNVISLKCSTNAVVAYTTLLTA